MRLSIIHVKNKEVQLGVKTLVWAPLRSLLHPRGKCKVTAQWKDDEQRFIYVRERALLLPKAHCGGMPQFFFFSFLIKTNCFLYRRGGELIRYNGTDISRKIRGRPGFFSLFYSQRDKRLAVLLHHAAKVCCNSGLCNTWAKTRKHIWDRKTDCRRGCGGDEGVIQSLFPLYQQKRKPTALHFHCVLPQKDRAVLIWVWTPRKPSELSDLRTFPPPPVARCSPWWTTLIMFTVSVIAPHCTESPERLHAPHL